MLESAAPIALRGNQRPSLLHLPDGSDAHVEDAVYLLGDWGFGYDDAQEFVIASSLREQPDGRWAAKEVGVEEPRQNGKGEIIEGREALGLFYLGERRLIHSAHEFATASEALDRMDDRIGRNPQLKQRVRSVKRSHGEEGVYLKDGRTLRYKTRTKGGGRGFSADLLILDEAMFIAEAFLGALMPLISARPNPQIWYTGSAVDQLVMDNGIVFARLRERARSGGAGRLAYFGWSPAYAREWKTPDDVPRAATVDPAVIAEGNPALGIRIDLDHVVETEREAMDHRTFCVERLGVGDWPSVGDTDVTKISVDTWRDLADPESVPIDPVCFAFDVQPERSSSAIAVAGRRSDGRMHVEIVATGRGTTWVVPRMRELLARHDAVKPVCDTRGPAGSLVGPGKDQLPEDRVHTVNAGEHAKACGMFFDACDTTTPEGSAQTLRHLGQEEFEAAIRGAGTRPLGDAWAWSRVNSSVDISPLVAGTLALWGAATLEKTDVWLGFG